MKKLILAGMLLATQCHAITYEWPYATHVDVEITGSTTAQYTVYMATAKIVDDSIGEKTTVAEVLQAHGKEVLAGTYRWGPYHRHLMKDGTVSASGNYEESGKMTEKWAVAARSLSRKYGSGSLRVSHSGVANGDECVGTGVWDANAKVGNWEDFLSTAVWNGGVTGACIGTPPLNQWCAMKTPTLEIAYGTMTLKDAEGTRKTAGVSVECTTGMKYTLRLREANNETTLDNGGRVTWEAGGKAMGETLTGEVGANSIDLTATLHGPFERTGEFQGSGVLFVSYP